MHGEKFREYQVLNSIHSSVDHLVECVQHNTVTLVCQEVMFEEAKMVAEIEEVKRPPKTTIQQNQSGSGNLHKCWKNVRRLLSDAVPVDSSSDCKPGDHQEQKAAYGAACTREGETHYDCSRGFAGSRRERV
jgi:hypothetical protein